MVLLVLKTSMTLISESKRTKLTSVTKAQRPIFLLAELIDACCGGVARQSETKRGDVLLPLTVARLQTTGKQRKPPATVHAGGSWILLATASVRVTECTQGSALK